MKIIDFNENYLDLYCVCLEDWSDEMKESGDHKKNWYNYMKDKGLCIKLALDDNGEVGGMIHYIPIEHAQIVGEDMYFINCIWVHGHKQGRGDHRKKGMGSALLEAAVSDIKEKGAKAAVAWGVSLPFWMRASWYKKKGFKKADKQGIMQLVWLPFVEGLQAPKWMSKVENDFEEDSDKVTVTALINGWCPAQNIMVERAKRVAAELGDKVAYKEIDTKSKEDMLKYGMADGIFIDNKPLSFGPPMKYEKVKKKISKQVRKKK